MNLSKYLLEASFSRIINILRGDVPNVDSVGIITAENPMNKQLSVGENNKRDKEFLLEMKRANFTTVRVGPRWIMEKFGGSLENSYLIPHISKSDLIEKASEHNQKAVIYGKKEKDEDGLFMRFEWIETSAKEDPSSDSYSTKQIRDVVITDEGIVDRKVPKKDLGTKFAIPFDFVEEDFHPLYDVSFKSKDLPDESEELVEEIQQKGRALYAEGKVPKWYWQTRFSLGRSMQKLRDFLDV